MKNIIQSLYLKLLFGLATLLTLFSPSGAHGQTFSCVTNDNAITITNCVLDGNNSFLNIPSVINGLPVIALKGAVWSGLFGGPSFGVVGATIPNSVTDIEWSFYYCFNMSSVTIPNSVTNLGNGAFAHSDLTSISIPASVVSIGDYAFWNSYDALTNVTFMGGVRSIGFQAFAGCNKLLNVTLPASVTNIAFGAFADSERGMTNISVDAANPSYASLSGVLYDKNFTTILQYPGGRSGSFILPDGVTTIADYSFEGCISLGSVTIPASVGSMGSNAFFSCGALSNFYFRGNAPIANNTVFQYDSGKVYYLPGTTGWGTNFYGLPTTPWYQPGPVILNRSGGFDAEKTHFGFTISWATNAMVVVDICTNWTQQVWSPMQTNAMSYGTNYFTDIIYTNQAGCFYRVRGL